MFRRLARIGKNKNASKPLGAPVTPQGVAADLVSRSAFLLYSALALFLVIGFVASSQWAFWPKLKLALRFAQVAVTADQMRRVWAIRPLDFWYDIRVRLSLVVFAAASLGPSVVSVYFFFFTPRFVEERGASLSLATMSLLFVFYGVLLLVSPRMALKFDYTGQQGWKLVTTPTPSQNLWKRFAGGFLFLVGILLAYVAIKMLRETLSR